PTADLKTLSLHDALPISKKFQRRKRSMKVKPKPSSSAKKTFTQEERAAIQERAREVKAEERRAADKAGGESELLAKIAEMQESRSEEHTSELQSLRHLVC